MNVRNFAILFIFLAHTYHISAQPIPNPSENIDCLITFGADAKKGFGDDDFTQIFFITVPNGHLKPLYLRVFDPETGGKLDDIKSTTPTQTSFSIYGGKSAFSHPDATTIHPTGHYRSGTLLKEKIFGTDARYDNNWYTFGPFNPKEGEYIKEMDAHVFKVIIQGMNGINGNLYKLFVSSEGGDNVPIDGSNAFTYEYCFRLHSKKGSVANFYPYIENNVVSINIHSFDFDNDGTIALYSRSKNREKAKSSGDNEWAVSNHTIASEEKNGSINVQIIKKSNIVNDMALYVSNQYDHAVPMFVVPIGGSPQFKYLFKMRFIKE